MGLAPLMFLAVPLCLCAGSPHVYPGHSRHAAGAGCIPTLAGWRTACLAVLPYLYVAGFDDPLLFGPAPVCPKPVSGGTRFTPCPQHRVAQVDLAGEAMGYLDALSRRRRILGPGDCSRT